MQLKTNLSWLFILILIEVLEINAQNSFCITPDGDEGECKGIEACPVLNSLRNQPKPIPLNVVNYLRQSSCNGPVKFSVCCSDKKPSVVVNVPTRRPISTGISPLLPSRSTCGKNPDSNRIVGGEVAGIDDFPWMVLIEYVNNKRQHSLACGGSLISKRYVLTASHCVAGDILIKVGNPTNVRLGDYDKSNYGRDCVPMLDGEEDCNDELVIIKIQKTIAHPKYDEDTTSNDIALIRLEKDAPLTDFIAPICIPQADLTINLPNKGLNLTTAGWGLTEHNSSSNVKLYVKLPFIELRSCKSTYMRTLGLDITDKQVCAGGETGKDSCRGDSGGPLMHKFNREQFELIGVVSFGTDVCGQKGVPGVYAKVYAYLDWISQNLES